MTASKKILLIEDHTEMRDLIAKSLRRLGYQPLKAEEGRRGVMMAMAENPDLVLLDLSLPGESGCDVAKEMRGNLMTSHIPIVACSVWQDEKLIKASLDSGAVAFVIKPFSATRLAAVINEHIGSDN
jgi:DNA-binding response OmpR family regulator